MGERYPDRIEPGLAYVLGMPPFELHPIWMALREVGVEVPTRYEGEVASALHFLIPFAIQHGADWRRHAVDELRRLQAGGAYVPPTIAVVPAGHCIVPIEPTDAMLDKGQFVNSEYLNDNAPIGEHMYRAPAKAVWKAMIAALGLS